MMLVICALVLTVGYTVICAQDQPPAPPAGNEQPPAPPTTTGDQPPAPPQPGPGGAGFGPGGRQFDPEQMRERMVENMREDLQMKDEEGKEVKPLLSDVVKLRGEQFQYARMGGMMGPRGPRGDRGGNRTTTADRGPRPDRPGRMGFGASAPELTALQEALDNPNTPPADLKAKMKALRDARKKAEEALQKAREKLREVLTPRQEAQLVLSGILD